MKINVIMENSNYIQLNCSKEELIELLLDG